MFLSTDVSRGLSITTPDQSIEKAKGETAYLPCKFTIGSEDQGPLDIEWLLSPSDNQKVDQVVSLISTGHCTAMRYGFDHYYVFVDLLFVDSFSPRTDMKLPKGQLQRNYLWGGNSGPSPLAIPAGLPEPEPSSYCYSDYPEGPSGSQLQGEQKSCSWLLIIQGWMDTVCKAPPGASSSSLGVFSNSISEVRSWEILSFSTNLCF